jgi:hypothetical protein
MRPLSKNDVEAELSYAYLHAVAAKAGIACRAADRHEDNKGIDAQLIANGQWPGATLEEVTLRIQLKATKKQPTDSGTHLSYWLKELKRFDDLRSETISVPRILVVLFLPEDPASWLGHSETELALRRCAYWVSLRGAPAASTDTGVNVKMPKAQLFSPGALEGLVERLARFDIPKYEET